MHDLQQFILLRVKSQQENSTDTITKATVLKVKSKNQLVAERRTARNDDV